jgi:DNA (cytosine-5)-methyltransferase 1
MTQARRNTLAGSARLLPVAPPAHVTATPHPITNRQSAAAPAWSNWVRSKKWPQPKESAAGFRIVDLFCGCGGMTLGAVTAAASAGYKCTVALAADMSVDAANVYRTNFGEIVESFVEGDISNLFPPSGVVGRSTIRALGKIDLLVAGPPCQGHSNLNNSTRRNDPRNKLYLSAITAIELLQPTMCIVENVPAVIHDKSGVTKSSIGRLRKAGYHVKEVVLHMERLGLPQKRRRHVLVGDRRREPDLAFLENDPTDAPTLHAFIRDLSDEWKSTNEVFRTPSRTNPTNAARLQYLFDHNLLDLPDEARPPCHSEKTHSYKSSYGRLSWDLPAQTITSGFGSMGQGRYVHPAQPRTITPHEAARIQGFPDFFDFGSVSKRTALQEIIANAVPPPAMATLITSLLSDPDGGIHAQEEGNNKPTAIQSRR